MIFVVTARDHHDLSNVQDKLDQMAVETNYLALDGLEHLEDLPHLVFFAEIANIADH